MSGVLGGKLPCAEKMWSGFIVWCFEMYFLKGASEGRCLRGVKHVLSSLCEYYSTWNFSWDRSCSSKTTLLINNHHPRHIAILCSSKLQICYICKSHFKGNKTRYLNPKHDLLLKKEAKFERRKEIRKLQHVSGLQKCTMPAFVLLLWLNLSWETIQKNK